MEWHGRDAFPLSVAGKTVGTAFDGGRLSSDAGVLLHTLRGLAPKRSSWREAQLDTVRFALVKAVGRVSELASRIKLAMPSDLSTGIASRAGPPEPRELLQWRGNVPRAHPVQPASSDHRRPRCPRPVTPTPR